MNQQGQNDCSSLTIELQQLLEEMGIWTGRSSSEIEYLGAVPLRGRFLCPVLPAAQARG